MLFSVFEKAIRKLWMGLNYTDLCCRRTNSNLTFPSPISTPSLFPDIPWGFVVKFEKKYVGFEMHRVPEYVSYTQICVG